MRSRSKPFVDPFTAYLPHLDLHGEVSGVVPVLVNSYIQDHLKMGDSKVVIIHGKGSGIVKKATHDTLRDNPHVRKYYIDGMNIGQTIAELK